MANGATPAKKSGGRPNPHKTWFEPVTDSEGEEECLGSPFC